MRDFEIGNNNEQLWRRFNINLRTYCERCLSCVFSWRPMGIVIPKWWSRRVRGGRVEDMLCNGSEEETWDFRCFADFGLKEKKRSGLCCYALAVNEDRIRSDSDQCFAIFFQYSRIPHAFSSKIRHLWHHMYN